MKSRNPATTALDRHHVRLEFCRKKRAECEAECEEMGYSPIFNGARGFIYTDAGIHYFVPPRLPDCLSIEAQRTVCKQWAETELRPRGMLTECSLFEDGPIFACPTRRLGPTGFFGDPVEQWSTSEFIAQLRESFVQAVHDALEKIGQPATYSFFVEPPLRKSQSIFSE